MKLKVLGIVILVVVLVHALFAFVLMRHGNEGGGEEPIVEKDLENDVEKPDFQYDNNTPAPAVADSGLPEAQYYDENDNPQHFQFHFLFPLLLFPLFEWVIVLLKSFGHHFPMMRFAIWRRISRNNAGSRVYSVMLLISSPHSSRDDAPHIAR